MIEPVFSQQDLQHFFKLSSDFLAILGPDGYFKVANPAFEQQLGWSTARLMAQPFSDFVHPEDQIATQAHTDRLGKLAAGEQTVPLQTRFHCADGSWRWLEWRFSCCQTATDSPVQFYGVARDITERKTANQQREQLKVLFEQAGVGIARLTVDGQWCQANRKLCEILGYPLEELLQTDFQSITSAEDAAADQVYYKALLSGELETAAFEKRYLRKTGESIWCNVTVSIIRDEQGQPYYFIAFIEDIRDRKAYELALKQQTDELSKANLLLAKTTTSLEKRNQELDEFAYAASHDLKAPLRAIANLATWIKEDLDDKLLPTNQYQFELLQSRVHRMENLIDGLLAYSRAGRGQQTIEPVNLNLLLRNVVDLIAPSQAFTINIPAKLPVLHANRVALTQVFSNLISNAIRHHHQSVGQIEIQCQRLNAEFVQFLVKDDGPGIDPAYHHKIFNIFQVLEARDKVENTGIGLAIVKKTVEAEGGEIHLDSQLGQGTAFRFLWPDRRPKQNMVLSEPVSYQPPKLGAVGQTS